LTTATLEQLNTLYTDGEACNSMVTIGTFELPYLSSSRLASKEWHWHWREEDGCLVAGEDQEYIVLPHPMVNVRPEYKALIAAAPDLLAVSEMILAEWQLSQSNEEAAIRIAKVVPDLHAAIAKAREVSSLSHA
jgi:hypothetical protein